MAQSDWLHPAFTLADPRGEVDAAALIEAGRHLDGQNLVLPHPDARAILAGLVAHETSGGDLFIQRDTGVEVLDGQGQGLIWLQSSGSTGKPKWASHRLDELKSRLAGGQARGTWLLTYAPGSFAGLQVILSAALGGHHLVTGAPGASATDIAGLAVRHKVSHISGTPTFWRAFLIALGDGDLDLAAVTLGGEAADQALLDALAARFPSVHLRHIYATTETGTLFTISDGRAGFPASWFETGIGALRLGRSERETLTVRGGRLGELAIDTGDCIAVEGDRALFRGRIDSMVNIGGVKVWPEEVEAHILALDCVADVLVSPRANPMTGHILVAEIVLAAGAMPDIHEAQIKKHVMDLPRAARPAMIRYKTHLDTGQTGKKARAGGA